MALILPCRAHDARRSSASSFLYPHAITHKSAYRGHFIHEQRQLVSSYFSHVHIQRIFRKRSFFLAKTRFLQTFNSLKLSKNYKINKIKTNMALRNSSTHIVFVFEWDWRECILVDSKQTSSIHMNFQPHIHTHISYSALFSFIFICIESINNSKKNKIKQRKFAE